MPYGRQAVAKPLVTRKARPDGEDIDPPTAAAIRTALARQNTPAGVFVDGSPSKRTMDALARAMAEDSIREDDAPDALSANSSAAAAPRPVPQQVSTAGTVAPRQSAPLTGGSKAATLVKSGAELEAPHHGSSLFSSYRAAILGAALLAALVPLALLYSSSSAAAAGSAAVASAGTGGGGPRWLNWLGRQLQRLIRWGGAS